MTKLSTAFGMFRKFVSIRPQPTTDEDFRRLQHVLSVLRHSHRYLEDRIAVILRAAAKQPASRNVTPTGADSALPGEAGHFSNGDSASGRRIRAIPPRAIVYCEANFGDADGKTANGLVRHSEKYKILAIIDSKKAGQDAGMALGGMSNGVPICADIADAVRHAGEMPDCFIFGMAPSSGMLSSNQRAIIMDAIGCGMDIVSGLHEFLGDDLEFIAAAKSNDIQILDIRRPKNKKDLRQFSGRIGQVTCRRIAVLGTDCAIGKRTTATILTAALVARGVKAIMVSTGQTGLIQGARYGVALDAVPSQFCSGEMEAAVMDAFEGEHPDVIVIEGQGALSHPAFSTSSFILRGSVPHAVILQHAPGRKNRCDFEGIPMPDLSEEIHLIETFSRARVIGITINHENMSDTAVSSVIEMYERQLELPATDALTRNPDHLVDMVLSAFPELRALAQSPDPVLRQ